jgi:hypothetical protein
MRPDLALLALPGISSQNVNFIGGQFRFGANIVERVQTVSTVASAVWNDKLCEWQQWSGWSDHCQDFCGTMIKTRVRTCRGGLPGEGKCTGPELERKACGADHEPCEDDILEGSCPYWSFWSNWLGCVPELTHECKQPKIGRRTRTRTCEDNKWRGAVGASDKCDALGEGFRSEFETCIVNSQNPLASGHEFGQWSECRHQFTENDICTMVHSNRIAEIKGTQTRMATHVCEINYPGDHDIPDSQLYIHESRACAIPIPSCEIVEPPTMIPDPCKIVTGEERITFYNQVTGRLDVRFQPVAPLHPPALEVHVWPNSFEGWSACMPRPGSDTTCRMQGVQRRQYVHFCAPQCNTAVDPNSYACKAAQEPYSFVEDRVCGILPSTHTEVSCFDDNCRRECRSIEMCEFEPKTAVYTPISCDVFSPQQLDEQCPLPAVVERIEGVCDCATEQTFRVGYQCGKAVTSIPNLCQKTVTVQEDQWQNTDITISSLGKYSCVCKNRNRMFYMQHTITTAENGQVCQTDSVKMGDQACIDNKCHDECFTAEVSNIDQCVVEECYTDKTPTTFYTITKQEVCTGRIVTVSTHECPRPQKPCCELKWLTVNACPAEGPSCPSDPLPVGLEQRIMVPAFELVGMQQDFCDQPAVIETREIPCFKPVTCREIYATCSKWSPYGSLSDCSGTLQDGTICGGNRKSFRTCACPHEFSTNEGSCLHLVEPETRNMILAGDTYLDAFTRLDSKTIKHHSLECWQGINDFWSEYSVFTAWSFSRCEGNSIVWTRSRTRFNKCQPDSPEDVQIEFKSEPAYMCVDTPVSVDALGQAATCRYDATGCAAEVSFECVAPSGGFQNFDFQAAQCTHTFTKWRPASRTECPVQDDTCSVATSTSNTCELKPAHLRVGECDGSQGAFCNTKCTNSLFTLPNIDCQIQPHWNNWTPFQKNVQIQSNWVDTTMRDYNECFCDCDPCGGDMYSTRDLGCTDMNMGTEYRVVNCPVPVFGWSHWETNCNPKGCYESENERFCESRRFWTTERSDQRHCQNKEAEVVGKELPPCQVREYSFAYECRHATESQVTCGEGIQWTTLTMTTFQLVDGEKINGVSQVVQVYNSFVTFDETILASGNVAGSIISNQVQICALENQYFESWGQWSGCSECSVEEFRQSAWNCNGVVPASGIPSVFINRVESKPCPVASVGQVQSWSAAFCSECDTFKTEERSCVGGLGYSADGITAMDGRPCQCGNVNRCCKPDLGSTIVNQWTESRTLACPPTIKVTERIEEDDCECGWCETWIIREDYCTGVFIERVAGQPFCSRKNGCTFPVPEFSECVRPAQCGQGHRVRPSYRICVDNAIQIVGEAYNTDDALCYFPLEPREIIGECDYSDPCRPQKTIQHLKMCFGATIDQTMSIQACPVAVPETRVEQTACSAQCGGGTFFKKTIRICDGVEISREGPFPCGCQRSASWSAWSAVIKNCDPCGPEVQHGARSRTCLASGAPECEMCQTCPNSSGFMTTEEEQLIPFNRRDECPITWREVSRVPSVCTDKCADKQITQVITEELCGEQRQQFIKCGITPDLLVKTEQGECLDNTGRPLVCGDGTRTIRSYYTCGRIEEHQERCSNGRIEITDINSEWDVSACMYDSCTGDGLFYEHNQKKRQVNVKTCVFEHKASTVIDSGRWEYQSCLINPPSTAWPPCCYWSGWSSIISDGVRTRETIETSGCSKCGGETRTRERHCVHNHASPFYRSNTIQGQECCLALGESALWSETCFRAPECDDCMDEWSGWSNCCKQSTPFGAKRMRLKYRGHGTCTPDQVKPNEELGPCIMDGMEDGQGSIPTESLNECSQSLINWKRSEATWKWARCTQATPCSHQINGETWRMYFNGASWVSEIYMGGAWSTMSVEEKSSSSGTWFKFSGIWYSWNGSTFQRVLNQQSLIAGNYNINGRFYQIYFDNIANAWIWTRNSGMMSETVEISSRLYNGEYLYMIDGLEWFFVAADRQFRRCLECSNTTPVVTGGSWTTINHTASTQYYNAPAGFLTSSSSQFGTMSSGSSMSSHAVVAPVVEAKPVVVESKPVESTNTWAVNKMNVGHMMFGV